MAEYQRCPCGFPKSVCWRCTPVVDFPEKVALKGAPSTSDTSPNDPIRDRIANPWLESLSPRAREHYLDDAPDDEVAPQVVEAAGGGLDDLLAALSRSASGVAKAAVRERDEWKAKAMKAEAELESLRQQLARIKSALGV